MAAQYHHTHWHLRQSLARWRGTVPWRLAMGTLAHAHDALGIPGGALGVGRQRGPAPSARVGAEHRGGLRRGGGHRHGCDRSDRQQLVTAARDVYGTGSLLDLPVTMSDGTVLRADVYFPTTARGRARRPTGSSPCCCSRRPTARSSSSTRRPSPTPTSTTSSTAATSSSSPTCAAPVTRAAPSTCSTPCSRPTA